MQIMSSGYSQDFFTIPLTLFKMGEQKGPPTSFSAVNSTNVGVIPQIFLTFTFNPFATLL